MSLLNGDRVRRRNSMQGVADVTSVSSRPLAPESDANLVSKGGRGFGKVFRAVRHVHQTRERYRCDLMIEKLSLRVPSAKKVCVEWVRGPHRVKSAHVPTLHKNVWTCSWPTPLTLTATLFSSQTGTGGKKYSPKETTIRFLEYNSAKTKNPERLGEIVLDLADVIKNPGEYALTTKLLARSLDPSARATFRLTCISLVGESSELSDTSSMPDDQLSDTGGGGESVSRRLFRRRQSLRHMLLGHRGAESENHLPPEVSPSQNTAPRGDASPITSDPESRGVSGCANELIHSLSPSNTRSDLSPDLMKVSNLELSSAPPGSLKRVKLPSHSRNMSSTPDAQVGCLGYIDERGSRDDSTPHIREPSLEGDVVADIQSANFMATVDRLLKSFDPKYHPAMDTEAKLASLERHCSVMKNGSIKYDPVDISEDQVKNALRDAEEECNSLHDELRIQQQANRSLKKQLESLTNKFQTEKQQYKYGNAGHKRVCSDHVSSSQGQLNEVHSINLPSDSPLNHLTKAELIAKLQRYEQAANINDVPKTVGDLEEQLILTKVQLAQAETEKEELLEKARKRIDDLKETARGYASMLSDMEQKLTELKLQQRGRASGSEGSSDYRWNTLAQTRKLVRGATTAIRRSKKSARSEEDSV